MKTYPKKGNRQLRKGRTSISNAYYILTTATDKRWPMLADDDVAQIIFDAFDWLEANERIRWECIMIMPDHIHSVIQLKSEYTLQQITHTLKRYTARKINLLLKREGRFWQVGYHDTGIRAEKALHENIKYCYENPVRKGIVKEAKDYPYWRCKYDIE